MAQAQADISRIEVLEVWTSAGGQTEHEITVRMPEGDIPVRGGTLIVPELGDVSVLTVRVLKKGTPLEARAGTAIVRMDVTSPPKR